MVFSIHKTERKDGTYGLHAQNTYYTDEYARTHCSFYLTDELFQNDRGELEVYYRLHAKEPHDNNMTLAYDVYCPKCGKQMRQITINKDCHTLGYYECKHCKRR